MRVITGSARGKKLITLTGTDVVRPTSERVKEAIFSAIQFDIEGRRVLDLFAGSGQLGIEALSRSAESAVFVDSSNESLKAVKQNLDSTGLLGCAEIVNSDYSSFLARTSRVFDIAFLDPPYKSGILEDALQKTVNRMSRHGTILCESPYEISLPESVGGFKIKKVYKFGRIAVTMYKGQLDNE